MKDSEQLLLLLAVAAAGFFVGMGYAERKRAQASETVFDGDPMAWLTSWGSGIR